MSNFFSTVTRSSLILPIPDRVDNCHGNGASQQFTVAAGIRAIIFSANGPFYVNTGTNPTAAIPVANVTDGSASIPNPAGLLVTAGLVVAIFAAAGVDVAMLGYS